jgi:hypothetical protein
MRQTVAAIRYALRQLRGAPVFAVAAVLTLALGIGGTTAIFTLIQAVMLKSLPVTDPDALYRIGDGSDCCVEGSPQDQWGLFSYPLFKKLRAQAPEFEQVTAFQAGLSRLPVRRQGVDENSRPLVVEYVSGEYFQVLGIGPFGGRVFTPDDDARSAAPVAVLSYHAWQNNYGSDRTVVGAAVNIDGHPFTIVGVAPPGFFGETLRGNPADVWLPIATKPIIDGDDAMLRSETSAWLRAIGRLKSGATTAGMSARLTGYLRNWIEHDAGYPANWMPDITRRLPDQHVDVVPAGGGVGLMKDQYKTSLQILLGVCGVVLLIACANVANLLLARAVTRRTQTAVRLALGASRRTLVFQALIEAIVLALLGAAAGLLVAAGASRLLLMLAFSNVQFLPISTMPSLGVLGLPSRPEPASGPRSKQCSFNAYLLAQPRIVATRANAAALGAVVPNTAVLLDGNGLQKTRALRSDGSVVTEVTRIGQKGPTSQRFINFADGTSIDVDDVRERKSTTYRNIMSRILPGTRDPKTDCLKDYSGTVVRTDEHLVEHQVVSDVPVDVVVSKIQRLWLAPSLSCATLRSVTVIDGGKSIVSDLVRIEKGEPDPTLFQVPARYQEVAASVLNGLSPGSAVAKSRDKYYFEHQKR